MPNETSSGGGYTLVDPFVGTPQDPSTLAESFAATGAINPQDIQYGGQYLGDQYGYTGSAPTVWNGGIEPGSGLGLSDNGAGLAILGNGNDLSGLTYDGQQLTAAQQQAAYQQVTGNETGGGDGALMILGAVAGAAIAAGSVSASGAVAADTGAGSVDAGVTAGASAGGDATSLTSVGSLGTPATTLQNADLTSGLLNTTEGMGTGGLPTSALNAVGEPLGGAADMTGGAINQVAGLSGLGNSAAGAAGATDLTGGMLNTVNGLTGASSATSGASNLSNLHLPNSPGGASSGGSNVSSSSGLGNLLGTLGSLGVSSYVQNLISSASQTSEEYSNMYNSEIQGLNQTLNPFAGQQAQYATQLSNLENNPAGAMSAITSSPAYQFSLGQGEQALQLASAAQGQLGSGATGVAIQSYGQQYAAQALQTQEQNLAQLSGANFAPSAINPSSAGNPGTTMLNAAGQTQSNLNNTLAGLGSLYGGSGGTSILGSLGNGLGSLLGGSSTPGAGVGSSTSLAGGAAADASSDPGDMSDYSGMF